MGAVMNLEGRVTDLQYLLMESESRGQSEDKYNNPFI